MDNKNKKTELIEKTLKKSKFDKYDFAFLKKCRLNIIWNKFSEKIMGSNLFLVISVGSIIIAAFSGFFAAIGYLAGVNGVIDGCVKLWFALASVTTLSTLPTMINAITSANSIIKKAEMDSKKELELDEKKLMLSSKPTLKEKLGLLKSVNKLIELYKYVAESIVVSQSELRSLEESVANLSRENQNLVNKNCNLKEETETLVAKKKVLIEDLNICSSLKGAREEIHDLNCQKANLVEELQLCKDLKGAREEFAGYQDIKGYQGELKETIAWLSKQMQTRYYIDGLVIGEAEDRETGSISFAPFKQTNEREKVSGFFCEDNCVKYIPLFNRNVVGTASKYGADQSYPGKKYPQVKMLKTVNVSDILHCMGWNNILTLGTISAGELTAVMKYVLEHKDAYGFTFNGEINEIGCEIGEFNAFLDLGESRKRVLPNTNKQ